MAYKLSGLAAQDFADIYEYSLLNFGVKQADFYTDELKQLLNKLDETPLIGKSCSDLAPELLKFPFQHHIIFYRKRSQDIFVVRFLHEKMQPKLHL
ncbi:MAG: hypothetical protein RL217_1318 [Pseudomonadota bacterium]|jgi:toxin ParE1/3/4